MQINNSSANALQLRRANLDSQRTDKSSDKTDKTAAESAVEPRNVQDNGDSTTSGQAFQELADSARDKFADTVSGGKGVLDSIGDILGKGTDERAAELFAGVDTENPTLVTNQGDFNVNASQGPEGSTYLDLGNGAEVFVFTQPSGQQVAYRVENGELGERIRGSGSVDIGNNIYMNIGESPSGDSEINFQQGRGQGFGSFFNRSDKMTLNSDNSMLTTKTREGSGFGGFFRSTEVNSFDIQSGEQLVTDGEADLDKMSPDQQFDYYVDTPEGAKILRLEGNHYETAAEKRLLVARAQYVRGEGGPELFNEFTPDRAGLSGDDLASYDAAVQDMMNEIREEGLYNTGQVDQDGPVDESLLYILASSAVEAYHESPETLEAVKGDINKWIVSTDNADSIPVGVGGSSAGWYSSAGAVQFSLEHLVGDYVSPNDAWEVVTHEFAHSLDNSDGSLDGLPPGLSAEDTELFIAERERLFDLAYPGGHNSSETELEYLTEVVDSSGLSKYAFYNKLEFWAKVTETFLSSDANAEIVKNASPELYDMLREYYNREDLPPSNPPARPPVRPWPPGPF